MKTPMILPAVALAAARLVLPGPARAEFNPAVRWLMNQPVSLWDRGMERMEKGAKRAANDLRRLYDSELFGRLGAKNGGKLTSIGSSHLNWKGNEILIQIDIPGFSFAALQSSKPSGHKICNTVRQFFLSILTFGQWHHRSRRPAPSPEKAAKQAHSTIAFWFSHVGYKSQSRDEGLEANLAQILFVEASVGGDLGNRYRHITCKARITEWNAPTKLGWMDRG